MSADEDLQLAPSTLNALAEFMREKDERDRRFEELRLAAEMAAHAQEQDIITMEYFEEDWNQSQFWYDDETACKLAGALLEGATDDTVIGLVSSPTVYVKIREWKATGKISKKITVKLFEYDQRFAVFKDDFIFYDFTKPLRGLPAELKGKFDRVLIDPPFLSADCQTKTALTVRWLTRPWTPLHGLLNSQGENDKARITLSTGERMRELVLKLYRPAGLREADMELKHRNGLSNEFLCYSNYASRFFGLLELPGERSDA